MKKSRSLFDRLQNGGLYLRHLVDAGGAFADVHIEKRPAKVHQSRLKLCALRVLRVLGGNKNNCVNPCESVKSVVKNLSIKNNKLCETNPISGKPKMTLSYYITRDYKSKSNLLTMEKQTQTKPILGSLGQKNLQKYVKFT
jgi:hypothetical protein